MSFCASCHNIDFVVYFELAKHDNVAIGVPNCFKEAYNSSKISYRWKLNRLILIIEGKICFKILPVTRLKRFRATELEVSTRLGQLTRIMQETGQL